MVANKIGMNTSVGSAAPIWARYIKMVTGSNVTDEVLSTRNKIWALVAVAGFGFKLCKACMAFKPSGVAALSSPSILAAKFMVMAPWASWPLGTSGIMR